MANESQVLRVVAGSTGKKPTADVSIVNESGVALFTSNGLVIGGDVRFYVLDGAPVDYTDGTPPATGEGEAGIGSLAVRTDTGKWYTNGGTKAQPIWKLITSAA